MATTTSDGIVAPTNTDPVLPPTQMQALASSVQDALNYRANSYIGTTAERNNALSSVAEGSLWVDTNGVKGVYVKRSNAWDKIYPPDPTVTVSSFLKAQSGWKTRPDSTNYLKKMSDGWVLVNWNFIRNGAALTVPANGDIVNQTVAIFNSEWSPNTWQPLHSGEGGRVANFTIGEMDGACHLRLNSVGGTSNIANGSWFQLRGWYHLYV